MQNVLDFFIVETTQVYCFLIVKTFWKLIVADMNTDGYKNAAL